MSAKLTKPRSGQDVLDVDDAPPRAYRRVLGRLHPTGEVAREVCSGAHVWIPDSMAGMDRFLRDLKAAIKSIPEELRGRTRVETGKREICLVYERRQTEAEMAEDRRLYAEALAKERELELGAYRRLRAKYGKAVDVATPPLAREP